jgi:hypothetical protein
MVGSILSGEHGQFPESSQEQSSAVTSPTTSQICGLAGILFILSRRGHLAL